MTITRADLTNALRESRAQARFNEGLEHEWDVADAAAAVWPLLAGVWDDGYVHGVVEDVTPNPYQETPP